MIQSSERPRTVRSALVTGAGSGIGQAAAVALAKEGYFVFLMGRRIDKLTETQKLIGTATSPNQSTTLVCDLNQSKDIERAVATIQAHPQLEVVVNNAAIYERNKPEANNSDLWRRTFAANLFGTVDLTERLIPVLKQAEHPSIVNVASTLGIKPIPETSAYSASKAALINWTLSLALDLAPKIRVNCVCPGIIDTPIHPFHGQETSEKAKTLELLNPLQPLGRIGTPEDVVPAILYFATTRSAWTTGSALTVDGGINISGR